MFLKGTYLNGTFGYINADLIESIHEITEEIFAGYTDDYIGKTCIVMMGMDGRDVPYIVNETPEELLHQMKLKKEENVICAY